MGLVPLAMHFGEAVSPLNPELHGKLVLCHNIVQPVGTILLQPGMAIEIAGEPIAVPQILTLTIRPRNRS